MLHHVQAQRDAVQAAEAEALMAKGDPVGAARLFGCIMTPHPPFEDIALRLVDTGTSLCIQGMTATNNGHCPASA